MPTLIELNGLTPAGARDFFFSCCGSSRWAEGMAACRPYWDVNVVLNAADVIWEYLSNEDRREALRNRKVVDADAMPDALREDLEYYMNKFGYSFVMAPPLPPFDELQTHVRRRLEYTARAEFDLAATQEFAIMRSEIRRRLTG
jgi:2-oxo-4-hydroxy-4-carboxy-5-ureidoimidazoline decarboxylase